MVVVHVINVRHNVDSDKIDVTDLWQRHLSAQQVAFQCFKNESSAPNLGINFHNFTALLLPYGNECPSTFITLWYPTL